MPKAVSLADVIDENFNIEAEIIAGSGGCFNVHVDDQLIFSKHDLGRFPTGGEIVGLLKNHAENS